MEELIKRLEDATEGSRELDADIFIAVTPGVLEAGRIDRNGGVVGWWPKDDCYQSARDVPRYTTSLDAALTLVPDGYSIVLHGPWQGGNPDGWKAQVAPAVRDAWCDDVTGATAPLALCIAALRAREQG